MILAFGVYIALLLYMIGMAVLGIKLNEKPSLCNVTTILPILLFTFVLGLRYDVGLDYLSYFWHYQNLSFFEGLSAFEPLYEGLNLFLNRCKAHYSVLFSLTVFIEIVFFYLIFTDKRFLLPYAILFFFLTSKIFVDLNIIRHAIATMIFIYSIRYIQERKFWKYVLFLFLAGGFHYSSFLLFPLWFLGIRKYFWAERRFYCLLLFGITLLFGSGILGLTMDSLIKGFEMLGYSNYMYDVQDMNMEVGSGLGVILLHLLDLSIILLSLYVNKRTKDQNFLVYFRVFFVGVLLANIFGLNIVLSRLAFALVSVRFIVLAYVFYYVLHYWKCVGSYYKCLCGFVFFSYMILFFTNIIVGANKCSPFQFISI